ncbi:hypothetical protein ABE65_010325 [Fictibacillus phosphorivorans]|uniref:Uncharacterized protein n=1 Tax=Fictibacillus phosphorivorans TaxID=1221500 RepID=A0A161INX5_9BACL|nr:hypothetical protein [Fictibacillus phosphorivorans]ANC77175.1 hypothetical protein ABE65_010325 [Fictibacillus phosphorivorans]
MTLQKYVQVELDGKTKLLRFDYNSVSDLEAFYGKGISAILTEEQMGFNTLRIFYTFGLKWKEHGITPQRVGNMLGEAIENGESMESLFKPIMKALNLSKLLGDEVEIPEDEEIQNPN